MTGTRVAAALAGLLAAASAAVAPRMTAEELVTQSELILRGHVTRSWTAWDSKHKFIWTHYEIAVGEMLRGPQGATVVVSEPGGSLDGVNMQTSGTLPFAASEDAVLFLYRTPIGYWRVVGGPQGKFTVNREGRVYAGSLGVSYVDPPGGAAPGTPLAAFQGIAVGDFMGRVGKLAAAHPHRSAQ